MPDHGRPRMTQYSWREAVAGAMAQALRRRRQPKRAQATRLDRSRRDRPGERAADRRTSLTVIAGPRRGVAIQLLDRFAPAGHL